MDFQNQQFKKLDRNHSNAVIHIEMSYSQNPSYVKAEPVPVEAYAATAVHVTAAPAAPQQQQSYVNAVNEAGAREFLSGQKWPIGLQETFIQNLNKIPIRFFICDDSGSMIASDGHRMLTGGGNSKFVQCTRWQELTDALKFHASIAKAAGAPTEFRLLNGCQPIRVGLTDENERDRYNSLMTIFDQSPGGGTPLCKHIREVIESIRPMEAQLRAAGQKACVIIATDGESSDGDIITAMQPLRNMPVWVVVRLCTDEDRIVAYWNNIDSQLELDMDVLDDLSGEAQEVMENNGWLTYGEPMHRLREFGVLIKEIDMMDSNKLSLDQIRRFCSIIFGGSADSYPHPELDFPAFLEALDRGNKTAGKVWDPVTQRPRDWIDREKLKKMAGKGGCTIS